MAFKLGDFVNHLFREGQYGATGVYTGQATVDVLASINKRLARVWGRADWKWGRELLLFNILPNVRQYTVAAASGNAIDRIQDLIPYDQTGTFLQGLPLVEHTTRDFYTHVAAPQWNGTPASYSNTGLIPSDYYNVGLDSDGNWQIIVDPLPTSASKMGGYAKGILTTYVVADVANNVPILYFPNDVILDSIFDGCLSDIKRIQGQSAEAIRLDETFETKMKRLVGEQIGVATDNTPPTTRLPATVNRMRRRGRRW